MAKHKEHPLVGRVKKAVKKSQRKLSDDKFEKELQRTINFLTELKVHISEMQASDKAANSAAKTPVAADTKGKGKRAKAPATPAATDKTVNTEASAVSAPAAAPVKAVKAPVKAGMDKVAAKPQPVKPQSAKPPAAKRKPAKPKSGQA